MATTDKHPPLDPRRHSTNKKLKAKPYKPFGTAVKTAEGSKRVKVGDKNTTTAKSMKAGESELKRRERVSSEKFWEEERQKVKIRDKALKGELNSLERAIIRKHPSFKKKAV